MTFWFLLLALAPHRATRAECDAEFRRELKEMGKLGMIGDPPISLGMGGFVGNGPDWSMDPCGYAVKVGDETYFSTRYEVNGKAVSKEEFDRATGWHDVR